MPPPRLALVTGAAAGLGLEIARGLASAGLTSSGWRVVGGPPEQPFALGAQTACAVALVFAALTLVPQVVSAVSSVTKGQVPKLAYPLIGAVLGYFARR